MIYPSVTKVLSPYVDFSMIRDDVLKAAGERGTAAHNACFAYAAGLPSFGMPDEVKGYFESFKRWFDSAVAEVLFIEERMIDDRFGFHGEPDILVKSKGGEVLLPDLKTPLAKSKSWRLQMAGYNRLIEISDYPNPDRIGSLRLSPEGKTPHMDWYEGNRAADFNVFLSCLNAYRFFNS
jgi:hypothetical protein